MIFASPKAVILGVART